MFSKVLIANRGEIAVRICRTLDALGIDSVAVYADPDRDSLHVETAGEAVALGAGTVADTYLDIGKIVAAASASGAEAVHPGYGFLSENADFAEVLADEGVAFIGPRPEHLRQFGLKHEARALAARAGVPLLPGSDVLNGVDDALAAAANIGYPVMLKSSAGGGGIGMHRCDDAQTLRFRFDAVARLASAQFGDPRLFVERCVAEPRHVEVQAFGDGRGEVVTLGDRDCSLQRRNQKVIEECPAPNLPASTHERMHADARALLRQVQYRSAGTVEFLYDADRETAYFLEVNTRLQVEHGVTELVYGIDLVRCMVELAAGELPPLAELARGLTPAGSAIEGRVYAEDPGQDFRPSPGVASVVRFPRADGVRVDTWLRPAAEVSPFYDPLLAKVMAWGGTREEARSKLSRALSSSVVHGLASNRDYLVSALNADEFVSAVPHTGVLANLAYRQRAFEVRQAGAHTTVQSLPARHGYWAVGIPPSGPMDDLAFCVGNLKLGNEPGAPGLEVTVAGPTLAFRSATTAVVAGYCEAAVDGRDVPAWVPFTVASGQVLTLGRITQGARAYLLVSGGLDVPEVMGSAATFTLGGIGGMNGRTLAVGDVVAFRDGGEQRVQDVVGQPDWSERRCLRVTMGPHCTDDFLTAADVRKFLAAEWTVHYHSNRTGVRLIGPAPKWARPDGGDAGLHPSNVHDNAYAHGAIDFTGDMPVILGPDGPSLGGFVCPAAVIAADRWKLGQLSAGETVRLRAVTESEARALLRGRERGLSGDASAPLDRPIRRRHHVERSVVAELTDVRMRRAGDGFLLVEFGDNVLDLALRLRVAALETAIVDAGIEGIVEMTAGIRSLLVRYDPARWSGYGLAARLGPLVGAGADVAKARVPSRIVNLPLSWDDPACRRAIDRYVQSVRADAPWCPDNIEFIRRINGLADDQAVKDIVFGADYLVMGLGDVYLGAPVATPLDPRHRLVTTKYNPARTWTAENSVGIGGAYLCIYGMEGPGGYQFVGRTLQVWNQQRRGAAFDEYWLLRPFDRIRFHEVDAAELKDMREAFPRGGLDIAIEEGVFDYARHLEFETANRAAISAFEERRREAFAAELRDWQARGLVSFDASDAAAPTDEPVDPAGAFVASPMAGSVWDVAARPGQRVEAGEVLFVVESMKAEFQVTAPEAGVIGEVLVSKGQLVQAGQALALAA